MRLALFLLSALSVAANLFSASELPFKVLSISPDTGQLYGTSPLTVVFSRPVVALGDDSPSMPPFSLRTKGGGAFTVPFKTRFVTTYIMRLDPDISWPPDLAFQLVVNPLLKSFDGIALTGVPAPVSYFTPPLTMYLSTVTSKRATELTDGMWAASTGSMDQEVPPDGVVEVRFSSDVDSTLIEQCFKVTPAVPLSWTKCESSTTCMQFTTGPLTTGASYTLILPKGCQYHRIAGALTEESKLTFLGLRPFQFPFVTSSTAQYRRYDMWLRHGLEAGVTMAQLASTMSLTTSGSVAVPFTLSDPRPRAALVRINAAFQPGSIYRLSFAASATVRDGFGLPLQAHSVNINTAQLPYFFVSLQEQFVVLEPPSVPWYHAALVQSYDPTMEYTENVYDVPSGSIARALWQLQYGAAPCGASCGTALGTLRSGSKGGGFNIQRFPMPNASGFYLRDFQSVPATYSESKFISVTDLSVTTIATAATDSTSKIFVWVTRMSTGAPVEGARVTIYGGAMSTPVTDQAAGVTLADGTVELTFTPTRQYLTLSASVVWGQELAVITNLQYSMNYWTPASQLTGALVTDLGIYRPQDTIHIKGYVRAMNSVNDNWVLPPSTRLGVYFKLKDANWITQASEQGILKSVTLDSTFGSFDAEVTLPADVKSGNQIIELRAYDGAMSDSFTTIVSESVLVADPRRPVAVLSVSSPNEVYVPGEPFLVNVKTVTGSDIPIGGANVTLSWTLSRAASPRIRPSTIFLARREPSSPSPPLEGTLSVVTDTSGTVTATLRLPQAQLGDSLTVSGAWVGPTGELLTGAVKPMVVRESPWTLDLTPSIQNPLPGFPFGVFVNLKSSQGVSLLGKTATLTLKPRPEGKLQSGISPVLCTAVTNGALVASCNELVLGQVGVYELSGSVIDDEGRQLTSTLLLGQSSSDWELRPLSAFEGVSLRLDRETYAVGDSAKVSLQSPFSNATLLLRWTSESNQGKAKTLFTSLPTSGRYAVDLPIGPECTKSCQLVGIVSVPRQSSFDLPVRLPISHLWDPQQPRSITQSLLIHVPDNNRNIPIALKLSQAIVLPGDTVTGTVQIPLSSGQVEVAIFAVDRAYLQLEPHPLRNLSQEVFNIQQSGQPFSTSDTRSSLIPLKALVDTVSVFSARNTIDPWLVPSWPVHPNTWSPTDVDLTDERMLATHTTCITEFPFGCPSDSWLYGFDGVNGAAGGSLLDFRPTSVSARSADAGFSSKVTNMLSTTEASPPPPATGPAMPLRMNFNPSPLFLGRLLIPAASASVDFEFKLPDDIGTFVVRAYAVSANHQFGAAETSVISRRSISLQARLPRLTRLGDNFTAGVIVESVSAQPRTITVVATSANSLRLNSTSIDIQGAQGPVQASFDIQAVGLSSGSPLTFTATVASAPVDAMQVRLPVLGTQSSVHVATSMALYSQTAGTWTWSEGLSLPAAAPGSGSLNLTLGVGRLPAVEAMAAILSQAFITGEAAIGQIALKAAFSKYSGSSGPKDLQDVFEEASRQLVAHTSPNLGLRYSTDSYFQARPDAYLNSMALQLSLFLEQAKLPLPREMTTAWGEALKQDLNTRALESLRYSQRPFSDWDLLASAFFGLGPQTQMPHPDLALSRLLAALPSCRVSTKLSLALAYILRSQPVPTQLSNLNQDLMNLMRVQGRFFYVSESRSVASAATSTTQAKALMYMARQKSNSPLIVEKLANWLAAGNGNSAGSGFSFGSGALSFVANALADYDALRGSSNPSMRVVAKNGGSVLLSADFQSAAVPVQSVALHWEDLPAAGDPIAFTGQGQGEVSVALGLDFIPLTISADPMYRGLFVEKVVRRLDALGLPQGSPLQLVESGAMVQVCVQITSPDDVLSLVVEDLSCGGLEPLDSNVGSLSAPPTNGGIFGGKRPGDAMGESWIWRWFDPLKESRQVWSDRVTWAAPYVSAGSNSVCYNAMANIPGVYALPPAKAFSSPQPELMGLSSGGVFVVSAGYIADPRAELARLNVPLLSSFAPKSCGTCTSPYQYCNVRDGKCTYYQAYAGGAPAWQPTLLVENSARGLELSVLVLYVTVFHLVAVFFALF